MNPVKVKGSKAASKAVKLQVLLCCLTVPVAYLSFAVCLGLVPT